MWDKTCLIKIYVLNLSRYIIAKNIMIGRNLKILREANGFTQQQMASFLGVNRSTYANYEVSARETPLDILEKAADILGADLSVFDYHALMARGGEAIVDYVRRRHHLLIGESSAEQVKIRIGAVYEHAEAKSMEVKGRCLIQGLPKNVTISSREMLEAMMEPISVILDTICSVIERTPPELVGDILKNGIIMTGGGSLLYGLDRLIEDVTGIKTRIAKDPIMCVALGTGQVLRLLDNVPEGNIDLSRIRRKI